MACQYQQRDEESQEMPFSSVTKYKVPVMRYSPYVSPPIPAELRGYKRGTKFGCFYRYDVLETDFTEFQLLDCYGEGAFGQVLLAWNPPKREYVAIKVLVDRPDIDIDEAADREIFFLERIREGNGCQFNLLQYHFAFRCEGNYCLVMEALEQSVFQFMKRRQFQPLSLTEIRPILKQIYRALVKLEELQIIHTDIKPENIMFVNVRYSQYKIKLVDFGNAILVDEVKRYTGLQTLYYRSPEMLLGAPYEHAIDMWSLGCTVAELYLGRTLYKGCTAYEQIRAICKVQGLPEEECLSSGAFTANYFDRKDYFTWVLKTRHEAVEDTTDHFRFNIRNLGDLLYEGSLIEPCEYSSAVVDRHAFIDLLKEMLSVKRSGRIRPDKALQHPFIRMIGLHKYSDCEYVKKSVEIMRLL